MEWSKYDSYEWTTSAYADDHPSDTVEHNWYIKPFDAPSVGFHQDHPTELIHFKLDKDKFNASAELARVYEIIMDITGNPPDDYAIMCAKKMFVAGPEGLSDAKKMHNAIHAAMKDYFKGWITHWGELEKDNGQLYLHHYWQLAEKFYKFYEGIKEPTAEQLNEISQEVRLHCEVGLMTDDDGYHPTFEIAPKNLRGYLWKSLAEDYENHWNDVQLVHCARRDCERIFGDNVQPQQVTCNSSCQAALAKEPDAIAQSAVFVKRDVS
tara:strand:+ start:507 stop:1304 length:798 start_codon:yes stop_codon:yes gene_type:complete